MTQLSNDDPLREVLGPALSEMSLIELRHTILRVVDQVRRGQAQIIEAHARLEGALGLVAELRAEIADLKGELAEFEDPGQR